MNREELLSHEVLEIDRREFQAALQKAMRAATEDEIGRQLKVTLDLSNVRFDAVVLDLTEMSVEGVPLVWK